MSNLHDVFAESLPLVSNITSPGEQGQPSSLTIAAATLPRIIVNGENERSKWIREGRKFLEEAKVVMKDLRPPWDPSPPEHLQARNEGDVVHHANTYLLNPVFEALNHVRLIRSFEQRLKHPGLIRTQAEQAFTKGSSTVFVDVAWKQGDRSITNTEFKRMGYLNPNKWRAIELQDAGENLKKLDDVHGAGLGTKVEAGATEHILHQVTEYARRDKIYYSSVCDYENFFALHFSKDYEVVSIIKATRKDAQMLLLGMVILAIENQPLPTSWVR
jgi:hypothetical protein